MMCSMEGKVSTPITYWPSGEGSMLKCLQLQTENYKTIKLGPDEFVLHIHDQL